MEGLQLLYVGPFIIYTLYIPLLNITEHFKYRWLHGYNSHHQRAAAKKRMVTEWLQKVTWLHVLYVLYYILFVTNGVTI